MFTTPIYKQYPGFFNLLSRATDPIVIVIAAYVSLWIKFNVGDPEITDPDIIKDYRILILFVFIGVWMVFPAFKLYDSWRGQSLLSQAKAVSLAWFFMVLVIIVSLFFLKLSAGYSRLWLGYWAINGWVFLLLTRMGVYYVLQAQRSSGRNVRRIVVIGAGDLGMRVVSQINKSPWMGYSVVAIFDDAEELKNKEVDGCQIVGELDCVNDYLLDNQVDELWLALPLRAELRMKKLLNDISHHAINIKLIPDIFGFSLLHHSVSEIAGMPVVNISVSPMDGINRVVKDVEDRILAFIILVLISPLMSLIALGVKFSSKGPVFFKQERVSWSGKKFNMYKFRSMPVNNAESSQWGNAQAKETTKIGRFLRKTSLDELPQFINVLRGDMSIVGPRPERSQFVDKFKYEIPGYMQKHMMKAGITGWAQVNGWRGDTCLKTRIEHDLYYIENWSLWFDIKIIFLTVFKGFIHKNAI